MVVEKEEILNKKILWNWNKQKLLKDNEKFDDYVEDIVAIKRGYLDKLREKRPFWNKIWGKKKDYDTNYIWV